MSVRSNEARPDGRDTESGAKLTLSSADGFLFADRVSWDSYNEGQDLPDQIERYHRPPGCYPESVPIDKIDLTGANRT